MAAARQGGKNLSGGAGFGCEELERFLDTGWAGHPVIYHDVTDSTNLQAKLEAENGAPHGALVAADMQTAGRGRRGRSWSSPPGANAYFTLILRPELAPDKASMLTPVMALAVAEGIRQSCGVETMIKWPNDIVIGGKKICGILAEMSVERDLIRYVVIGVGINVGLQEFPPEVADVATCLQRECGHGVHRAELVAAVMGAFEKYYKVFTEREDLSGLIERYNELLVNTGSEVRVLDPAGEFQGISRGVNTRGELRVEREDGSEILVYAGEVSVRGIYGYV